MMQQPQGLHPALLLVLGPSGTRQLLWFNIRAPTHRGKEYLHFLNAQYL